MADTPQMPPILTDAEIAEALRPLYQPEALAALVVDDALMEDFRAVARAQTAKDADGRRYRAFFDAGLPITFEGVEYRTKADLDAAIDARLAGTQPPQKADSD